MKKRILTLTALSLAATVLTGCSDNLSTPNSAQGSDLSATQSTSTDTESTSTIIESTSDATESTESISDIFNFDKPRERFVYGEKEIPDVVHSTGKYNGAYLYVHPDGRIDSSGFPQTRYDERMLDSMVFETHTFGDYTIRLVGDEVRTDKEHFPGIIYTKNLRVEVEKNGADASGFGDAGIDYAKCSFIYPPGAFWQEELLFEDQIGNYLDIYDMKYPVIAMRYFHYNDIDPALRKNVQFFWIEDDKIIKDFFGRFAENTGLLILEPASSSLWSIFSADEFKVENENTLIDEIAGIKYIFDFDKPNDGHFFYTEKIG